MSLDDDDRIDQETWKAARDLAKRAVATLDYRPVNFDAYVAGVAKAKREQHGSDLRKLVADGLTAVEAADRIEATAQADLTQLVDRFKGSSSVRTTADPTAKTGEAQRRRMEEQTRQRREESSRWMPPSDEEHARSHAYIDAARAKLRADNGINDLTKTTAS